MPDRNTRVKKFTLPAFLFSKKLLFLLALALTGIGFHHVYSYRRAALVEDLLEENVALRSQVALVSNRISAYEADLLRIEHLDTQIREIMGIKRSAEPTQRLAVGGPTSDADRNPPLTRLEDRLRFERINSDIDNIFLSTRTREASLESLLSFFEEQKSALAAVPSVWPTRGWITSGFGYRLDPYTGSRKFHTGLDIATLTGTPIVAPADGLVSFKGYKKDLGKTLTLDHGYGLISRYGHVSEIYVKQGQKVKRGQVIAAVGSTGRSTGPHLHYEVRVNGLRVDPRKYLLNE